MKSEPIVLDPAPFRMDIEALLKAVRMPPDSEELPRLRELAAQAERVARPKAVYRPAFIDAKGEDSVTVEGHTFTSRILRVNLEAAHRVFGYVATSGMEIEAWSLTLGDPLEEFWADVMKRQALAAASEAFDRHFTAHFGAGKTARMNPGSLEDWPMAEQRPLWELIGDPTRLIGVTLKESFLMVPIKSVSGIRFPTEVTYENCQLCPRAACPGRRAAYEPQLYEQKYRAPATD